MGLIEQGKRWPRLATLLKISDALGMTIEDVLKGIQKKKRRH
jgi:transcriptional regulator with XRE-family HTH domain